MPRRCIKCDASIELLRSHAKFCSPSCRVSHHQAQCRSKSLPVELTTVPRWVRHDARKRPLEACSGALASVTDPHTWTSYEDAAKAPYGVGLGFVLSAEDDIACIDIDDCVVDGNVSEAALAVARSTPDVFLVELSPSKTGIHVWYRCENAPGTNRVENGIRVERYTQARYLTITGNRLEV